MSIRLELDCSEDFIIARYTGDGKVNEIYEMFPKVLDNCIEHAKSKLLLDMGTVTGEFSVLDRFQLGEASTIFLGKITKIAAIVPLQLLDPKKIGETVARNRGMNVLVFTDYQQAVDWLSEN